MVLWSIKEKMRKKGTKASLLASARSVPNLSVLSKQNGPPTTQVNANNVTPSTLSYYYAHTPLPPQHQHLINNMLNSQQSPNASTLGGDQLSSADVQQLSEMLYFPKYKKATHSAVCYRCKHQMINIVFDAGSSTNISNTEQVNFSPRILTSSTGSGASALLKVYDPNLYNLNYNESSTPTDFVDNSEQAMMENGMAMAGTSYSTTIDSPLTYPSSFTGESLLSQSVTASTSPELTSSTAEANPETPTSATNLVKTVSFANSNPKRSDASLLRESFLKAPSTPAGSSASLKDPKQIDKKRFSFNPNAKKKEIQQMKQIQLEKEKEQQKLQQRINQLNDEVQQLEKRVISPETYDMNVEYVKELFQYVSDTIKVDTPLCLECMEQVASQLNHQLTKIKDEENIYVCHYEKMKEQSFPDENDLLKEMLELEEEEKNLRKELNSLQKEEAELYELDKTQEAREEAFSVLQEAYWKEYNDFHNEVLLYNEEREAIQQRILYVTKEMEKLNSTNVFNDSFHIWYEGHFGTINNFRLGKLPTQNVEWNEINAAWGQAALLLFSLSKHKHFAFSKYKIIPMGSFSRIETLDNKNSYDLFGGGSNGGLFWQSKFDKAMVAFLHCLKEIGSFAEKQDTYFELPYK